MFKVKIGEDEYEVTFWHIIPTPEDREAYVDKPVEFRTHFGTGCIVTKLTSDGKVNGQWGEWSELSLKDNFNRGTGRKVSLSKVLKRCYKIPYESRKLFWQAYYQARGNKW